MTLSASVLGARLDALVQNVDNEAAATEAIADAFADYFVGGNPPNPANAAIAGAVPVNAAAIKTTTPPAWAPSTAYSVGQLVSNGGNAYTCVVAGTSAASGGPTGTGTGIIDGTVTWDFAGTASGTNPKAAMKAALAGMSVPSVGAAKIQAGVSAFWATLAAPASAYFTGATAITPPPGLAGLAATLTSVFAANTAGAVDKTTALNNVATAIHAANAGGIATFPTPVGPQTIT